MSEDPTTIPPDPIYAKSLSKHIALAALCLVAATGLAIYDEVWMRRPYKGYQKEFVEKYSAYLDGMAEQRLSVEKTLEGMGDYKALNDAAKEAREAVDADWKRIDTDVKNLSRQIRALNGALKKYKSKIAALNYSAEDTVHHAVEQGDGAGIPVREHAKARDDIAEIEAVRKTTVTYTYDQRSEDNTASEETGEGTVQELDQLVGELRDRKTALQGELATVIKPASEALSAQQKWLKNNLGNIQAWLEESDDDEAKKRIGDKVLEVGVGPYLASYATALPPAAVLGLKEDAQNDAPLFGLTVLGGTIKETFLPNANQFPDRCETCHMGINQPVPISAEDVPGPAGAERLFVSHPAKDLIADHPTDKFGCSLCHGGNGVAITNKYLAHGRNKYWLYKMHPPENFEAGCTQCHQNDWHLENGDRYNAGRKAFLKEGCWGCHEYDGYDVEAASSRAVQSRLDQITSEIDGLVRAQGNLKAALDTAFEVDEDKADAMTGDVKRRGQALTQKISGLRTEAAALAKEKASYDRQRKRVGPNLREVRKKVKRGWLKPWVLDGTKWRPSTKMPRFRWEESFDSAGDIDQAVKEIAAYIWQSADEPELTPLKKHPKGDEKRGKDLFDSVGCMACHSIGEGETLAGGDFASNLSFLGDKIDYDYVVSWIQDPRKHNPHTVMPSLRLDDKDARDIATYLVAESGRPGFTPDDGDWIEDEALAAAGAKKIRHFGCAGCHEIGGMESEGRIGVALTKEGSKPHEQLDFGHFTAQAKRGTYDPLGDWTSPDGVKMFEGDAGHKWYGHRGFFMRKLAAPGVYDIGKNKEQWFERLRMPQFNLDAQKLHDLTTFLLGAVETDALPQGIRYRPDEQGAAIQEGWKVVKRYNCQGCHTIQPGDVPTIATLAHFLPEEPNFKDLPPSLVGTGFRTDPSWLAKFLDDPSLGGGTTAPKAARPYLATRMPTFYLSGKEIVTLVAFFNAMADQEQFYDKPALKPLTTQEKRVAEAIFKQVNCTQCHVVTGVPMTTETKSPNLTLGGDRLRPEWMRRWIENPPAMEPTTGMSKFFEEGADNIWHVPSKDPVINGYKDDHIDLMVRYVRSLGDAAK